MKMIASILGLFLCGTPTPASSFPEWRLELQHQGEADLPYHVGRIDEIIGSLSV